MKTLGYYNGTVGELEDIQVPMLDRVCYFGDGVYDATYAHNHIIYCLDAHVERFYNSARLLGFDFTMKPEELKALLNELVQKVDSGDQFVYWQITRGTAVRDHKFPQGTPVNLWVMLRHGAVADTYGTMDLITVEDTRFYHCNCKTLNLLPNVLAAQQVSLAGCDEAVFHRGETVTECSHSNLHILQNGVLKTHPTDCHILPGIARKNLIVSAQKLGIPVDETPFTLAEMWAADEVIVSSSGTFCMQVATIDGKAVGGRASQLLRQLQDDLVADFREKTETMNDV